MGTRRIRIRRGLVAAAALVLCACGSSTITRSTSAVSNTDDYGADIPVRLTAAAVSRPPCTLQRGAGHVRERDSAVWNLVVDTVRSDQAGCAALTISSSRVSGRRRSRCRGSRRATSATRSGRRTPRFREWWSPISGARPRPRCTLLNCSPHSSHCNPASKDPAPAERIPSSCIPVLSFGDEGQTSRPQSTKAGRSS